MRQITYAEKSLLVDDEPADLIIQYAKALAQHGQADTVTLHCVGADGNEVHASFLLNPSTNLMVESTNSTMTAPDNTQAVVYMLDCIARLNHEPRLAATQPEPDSQSEFE